MMEGRSGAGPITKFDPTDFDTKFAHEVKNFDPQLYISRKEVQRMDLFTQYAIAAAVMATDDAGIDYEKTDRNRVGVIIGSGIGGMWTYHHQQQNLYDRGGKPDRISPFFIPMLISDIAAGQVAIRYGLKGPNYATVSACATSSHSIADALMLMQRGDADVMVVGEMRNIETIRMAVTSAQTGHLVFSTLHTNNASQTIERIIDVFPAAEQKQIRVELSVSLLGVYSQKLIPAIDGTLVPAYELMVNTPAVSHLIREGRVKDLDLTIENGMKDGHVSYNRSLSQMFFAGTISKETALNYSQDKDTLLSLIGN
jgi:hypothetical protein